MTPCRAISLNSGASLECDDSETAHIHLRVVALQCYLTRIDRVTGVIEEKGAIHEEAHVWLPHLNTVGMIKQAGVKIGLSLNLTRWRATQLNENQLEHVIASTVETHFLTSPRGEIIALGCKALCVNTKTR